jgi:hypothetical protein
VRAGSARAAPSATGSNGRAKVGPADPAAGRTAKGTFAAGNKVGRGNPHARRLAAHREALLSVVTTEKLIALGERMLAAAMGGDWLAAKLLLSYVIGKPAPAVDPDAVDLDEFRRLVGGPSLAATLYAMTQAADPAAAVAAARGLMATDAAALERQLEDVARRAPATFDRFFQAEAAARAGR